MLARLVWPPFGVAKKGPSKSAVAALPVIVPYRQHDKTAHVLSILNEHDNGYFTRSAPFVDEMMTDDRIQGVSNTRIGAVLSSPLLFNPAGPDKRAMAISDEILLAWEEIFSGPAAAQILKWGIHLGFGFGRIEWDKSPKRWLPRLVPWHPMFVRWDTTSRRFVTQTERGQVYLPRPDQQPRSDGQWFVYCPYGVEYGWRSGLVRSLAHKYISRQWVERDWDRWDERQGLGILKGITPSGQGQPGEREAFFAQLGNIGNEAAVLCPQDAQGRGYDIEIAEFTAQTWQGFEKRRDKLDSDIAITIIGQNLTTEVSAGGSRAAASEHTLVRIDFALQDANIAKQVKAQILSWYCEYNYGDPELAPTPVYEVAPTDDDQGETTVLKTLGEAAQALVLAEPRVDTVALMEQFSVPLITEEEMAAREADEIDDEEEDDEDGPPGGPGGNEPEGDGGGDGGGAEDEKAALSAFDVRKRYAFAGMPIAVENPEGSIRTWTDGEKTGSTRMLCDYGYIEGHLSGDGEELDVYVGGFAEANQVYVVHQRKAPDFRTHDEDKIMLGFATAEEARACYLAHRDDGDRSFGGMTVLTLEQFKAKLRRRRPESVGKIHASQRTLARYLAGLALGGPERVGLKRTATAKRRANKYHDRLIERSIRVAAHALAADVATISTEVEKATSLADVHARVMAAYRKMGAPSKLADAARRTNILAALAGRLQARREV